MKLNSQANEVLTNSTKESKFTINASAQAFKILSDGLYEHKIAAIVRELSCNAYDAHIEAGNSDVPFKVVLPNNLHPYFEIEDFGIGLDDDGVREVYTSYFTSTKNDSNDAIGAFGLGSKTPFSYTNNFTIRARKDGTERVYSAYIGSDGAPCVNMMYEKKTDEGNGVKITVPVKEWDFNQFKYEASFVLSFFKTQPIVTDPNFEICAPGVIEELDELGIVTKKLSYSGSSLYTSHIYAVMGGVCYRLDEHWIRDRLNDKYLNDIVLGSTWSSDRATLFIKFDIGELEVAASRETLSLDEDTRDVVLERVKDRVEILKKDDQEKVDAQGHMIKAVKHIYDLYNLGQLSCGMFSYNGVSLKEITGRNVLTHLDVEVLKDVRTYSFNKKRVKRYDGFNVDEIASAQSINAVYYRKGQKKSALIKHTRKKTPDKGNGICLMFNDPLSDHQRNRIEKYIGLPIEWFNLQDLKDEEAADNPTQPKASTGSPAKPLEDTTIRAVSTTFDTLVFGEKRPSQRIDLLDGKEYYWSYNNNQESFFTKRNIINQRLFHQCAKLLGKDPANMVVVYRNTQNEKKLDKNNIPCFSDIIKEAVTANQHLIVANLVERKIDYSTYKLIKFIRKNKPHAVADELAELDDLIDPDTFNQDSIETGMFRSSFYDEFGLDLHDLEQSADDYSSKLFEMKHKFFDEYPMLALLRMHSFEVDQNVLNDYIAMVDSQNN